MLKTLVRRGLRKAGVELRRLRPERAFIPQFVTEDIAAIERSIEHSSTRERAFHELRSLTITDFGLLLLSMPNPDYPRLSRLLPRMASKEVQEWWTGSSGIRLFTQTLDFVRSVSCFCGKSLYGAKILDFGCGYGRLLRMMYYFSAESKVYGVDPWDKSIERCSADGLANVFLADYLPSSLPVPAKSFELIYAFSVFTHLSERAMVTCLKTLHNYLSPTGTLAITIRPVEQWAVDGRTIQLGMVAQLEKAHRERGFAFLPHERTFGMGVPGQRTLADYGDTTLSLEWLATSFPDLCLAGIDRSLSDPYQIYVYLQNSASSVRKPGPAVDRP